MIIEFAPNLKEQKVYAQGQELATIMGRDRDVQGNRVYTYPDTEKELVTTFRDPVLVTDNYQIGQLEPSTLKETVFALYQSPLRTTEYDGTSLPFEQRRFPGVWGPSIDTLLFCCALRQRRSQLGEVRRVLEIGPGSGFVSKYLLEHFPTIEEITLIDRYSRAIFCSQEQIIDPRARFQIGDAKEILQKGEQKYDFIACNPPYIPRPKSIDDNPYEGVGLLVYLIQNAARLLNPKGKIFTNISSLCPSLVDVEISKAGLKAEEIASMDVPLKVFNVLNNPEWMRYLTEEKGLKSRYQRGYDYWQTINILALSAPRPKAAAMAEDGRVQEDAEESEAPEIKQKLRIAA